MPVVCGNIFLHLYVASYVFAQACRRASQLSNGSYKTFVLRLNSFLTRAEPYKCSRISRFPATFVYLWWFCFDFYALSWLWCDSCSRTSIAKFQLFAVNGVANVEVQIIIKTVQTFLTFMIEKKKLKTHKWRSCETKNVENKNTSQRSVFNPWREENIK